MKKIIIGLIILALIAGAVAVSVKLFSLSEDTWICENGQWIRHGNPDSVKPTDVCPKGDEARKEIEQNQENESEDVVGADRDDHGCIGSAGYTWCPSTKKCQKMWEEYCPEYKDQFRITDYNSCVAAGYPVEESYPRQCVAPDGQTHTESLGNTQEKSEVIKLESPKPNEKIKSPLEISGLAKGSWYFEGAFSASLVDWDGLIIGEGVATAQGDWMSEDFVPFKAKISFNKPSLYNRGALILKKSNPSGLPQNDDALEIPILFAD